MTVQETARITPGRRAEVGVLTWVIAQVSGRVTGTTPPNLFLVLGRHRRLFRGWLRFASRLMPRGTLPRREAELVILRVGHLRTCEYEIAQHERLGRQAGLTADELARVAEGASAPGWTPREAAILTAADELHHDQDLSDHVWARLRGHLDERSTIELVLLVAHYEMLATTIAALRIPTDRPRREGREARR